MPPAALRGAALVVFKASCTKLLNGIRLKFILLVQQTSKSFDPFFSKNGKEVWRMTSSMVLNFRLNHRPFRMIKYLPVPLETL